MAEKKSRGCALLGALGRLYERCHLLLLLGAGPPELAETAREAAWSMAAVLARLLAPFSWLRPLLLRLVESHRLHDVPPPADHCLCTNVLSPTQTAQSFCPYREGPLLGAGRRAEDRKGARAADGASY